MTEAHHGIGVSGVTCDGEVFDQQAIAERKQRIDRIARRPAVSACEIEADRGESSPGSAFSSPSKASKYNLAAVPSMPSTVSMDSHSSALAAISLSSASMFASGSI
jgi:hypothetical protein